MFFLRKGNIQPAHVLSDVRKASPEGEGMKDGYQVFDGDSFEMEDGEILYLECCECSLVHKIKFSIKGNKATLTPTRDNRRTGQRRRYNKITMTKEYE